MSLDKTPPNSFEERLNAYSESTKETVKKPKGFGSATGYFAGTAAALAMGTTEAEAAITVYPLGQALDGSFADQEGFDVAGYGASHPNFDFLFQGILNANSTPGHNLVRFGTGLDQIIEIAGRNYVNSTGVSYSSYKMPYLMNLGDDVTDFAFLPNEEDTLEFFLASSGSANGYGPVGDWVGGATGYIGFRIDGDGVAGGDTFLGWLEVRVDASGGTGELIRYAIEDNPNATELIITGIPEPSSLSCLALGAAGLLGWRQRRKNVA